MQILSKHFFKVCLRGKSYPLLQNVSLGIKQVDFRLVEKAQSSLEIGGSRIVGVQIGELDPAEILCFEPMDHGRHRAAGASGKAEEFDEL